MNRFQAKTRYFLRRGLFALALLCCLMCFLPRVASAAEPPDTTRICSLTLSCNYQSLPLPNMQIRVYRVASGSTDSGFTLSDAFASVPVQFNGLSASGWSSAASTLASFIETNGVAATSSALTATDGTCNLQNLSQGLYLVVGDTLKIGLNSYIVEPFLIALPTLSQAGAWQYDVTAYPKITDPEETRLSHDLLVQKRWVDAGTSAIRPNSITVALLRNGVVYDTRTLTAAMNWRYTWTNLSDQYSWSAIETTRLNDYTVSYQRSATATVIVNTARALNPGDDEDNKDNDIPQTGILWWPVETLAIAGIVLFTIGWRRRFRDGGENHAM